MVIAGLRKAEVIVREESKNMPIQIDPMENEVLRDYYFEAVAKGREEGVTKGREESAKKSRVVLARLLEKRFGSLPGWAVMRVSGLTPGELDGAILRVLDAATLDDFFGQDTVS